MLAAGAALLAASPALADPAPPPPFLPDRTAEDYAYLRDPARRGHAQDAWKFVPLDGSGNSFLSFGGEIRERLEIFDAPRFGLGGAEADSYLLQRLLLHADLHLGDSVRLFAQVGAHEAFGKHQLLPVDEDHLDAQQLFVEVRPVAGLAARLGRQELAFNPLQRFVSFRDGTNVRQNFDGGRISWNRGPLRLEAFLVRPVTLERGMFDDSANRNQTFGGLYASHRLGPGTADAYWFVLDREALPSGRERRHSFGLRYAGTSGGLDWDLEVVRQAGDHVRAWAASADLGYSRARSPLKPRFGLRFDSGSGDGDPGDGRASGFLPLFPSGPYHNEANLTSWTNLVALRPSIRIQPAPRLTLAASVQLKWRETVDDAVYVGPSVPLAATRGNRAREIGQAWAIDAGFQIHRNIGLRAYWLHHDAGAAISQAGGRDADFLMASATLRF